MNGSTLMNGPTFWIVARSTGLVAYGLMTVTMLAGLLLAGRARPSWTKPADVMALHRTLSLSALFLMGLHGVALALDHTVHLTVKQLLIPGLVAYRPVWVALGVTAAWVAVAMHSSFRLRKVIGPKVWRKLHFATYAAFVLATAHGLGAGTDSGRRGVFAVYAVSIALVAGATAWRAGVERKARRQAATPLRAAA
ncbi:MAG: ferric reductase-like transmembrane domain-containing protein [Thermoleophilia bacterium]